MTPDDDIDGLAAEYVLGSLNPEERRVVDARRSGEPALLAAIAAWERRLGPLGARVAPVAPVALPPHVRERVLARVSALVASANLASSAFHPTAASHGSSLGPIDGSPPPVASQAGGINGGSGGEAIVLRRQVRRLHATAWFTSTIAASLAFALVWLTFMRYDVEPMVTALLPQSASSPTADEGPLSAAPAFVLVADPRAGKVSLQLVAGKVPEGRTYQLWMAPDDGGPLVPICRIKPGERMTKYRAAPDAIKRKRSARFLVTLEPLTEVAPSQPTGPALAAGRLNGDTD